MSDVNEYLRRRLNEDMLDDAQPIKRDFKKDVIGPKLEWYPKIITPDTRLKRGETTEPSPAIYDISLSLLIMKKIKTDAGIEKIKSVIEEAITKFYNTCHKVGDISHLTLHLNGNNTPRVDFGFKVDNMTSIEFIEMVVELIKIMTPLGASHYQFSGAIHDRKYWGGSLIFSSIDIKTSFPKYIFSKLVGRDYGEICNSIKLLSKDKD